MATVFAFKPPCIQAGEVPTFEQLLIQEGRNNAPSLAERMSIELIELSPERQQLFHHYMRDSTLACFLIDKDRDEQTTRLFYFANLEATIMSRKCVSRLNAAEIICVLGLCSPFESQRKFILRKADQYLETLRNRIEQFIPLKKIIMERACWYADHYLAAPESKRAKRMETVIIRMAKRGKFPVNELRRGYNLRYLTFDESSTKLSSAVQLVNLIQVSPVYGRWRLDTLANRSLHLRFDIQDKESFQRLKMQDSKVVMKRLGGSRILSLVSEIGRPLEVEDDGCRMVWHF
jgi:hypothetical protein